MNQSSTSPASSSPSAISSSSLPQSKKKSRHSYGSLTVRIALKNGGKEELSCLRMNLLVPKPNQRRRTVPSSVFLTYSLAKASISPSLAISDQSINNEDDENEENSLDEQEYEDQGAI